MNLNLKTFFKRVLCLSASLFILSCAEQPQQPQEEQSKWVFPHKMPTEKPNHPLSAAMERMFDNYPAPCARDNEFYTNFKYTELEGFDYNDGDGTVTRRDPSRPIFVNGKYYIWYTKRDTKYRPIGSRRAAEATDEIPSTDWDLADIWYATSEDGFTWAEQGLAVARPEKPKVGWRAIATPDILVWKGKYYLYYQAFNEPSGLRGDWCEISVAYADSPDGPWTNTAKVAVPHGKKGEWDQDQLQDPHPIVYNDKIYLYYKAAYNKWPDDRDNYAVAHGVAIAEDPLGPFVKPDLNPVVNTGHETTYFPYKEGVAAIVIRDGNERETIQYAPDGINFEVKANVSLTPTAAGLFSPDNFTNSKDARGGTWGMCHFINVVGKGGRYSMLARFDCDLSQDYNNKMFKVTTVAFTPDVYFKQHGLGKLKREKVAECKNYGK